MLQIGVVVWFGTVEDKSKQDDMVSYIPMTKFEKRLYGKIKVTNISLQSNDYYNEYIVHVDKLGDPKFETHQVSVVVSQLLYIVFCYQFNVNNFVVYS